VDETRDGAGEANTAHRSESRRSEFSGLREGVENRLDERLCDGVIARLEYEPTRMMLLALPGVEKPE
jgi:hypothetical protein